MQKELAKNDPGINESHKRFLFLNLNVAFVLNRIGPRVQAEK